MILLLYILEKRKIYIF